MYCLVWPLYGPTMQVTHQLKTEVKQDRHKVFIGWKTTWELLVLLVLVLISLLIRSKWTVLNKATILMEVCLAGNFLR